MIVDGCFFILDVKKLNKLGCELTINAMAQSRKRLVSAKLTTKGTILRFEQVIHYRSTCNVFLFNIYLLALQ